MKKVVIYFIIVCTFSTFISGCDNRYEPEVNNIDATAVLDWNASSEFSVIPQQLPVLQAQTIQVSTPALEDAVKEFMNIHHSSYSLDLVDTDNFPESHFLSKWTDYAYVSDASEQHASALVTINSLADDTPASFELTFRTFENSYIRQTFILPDEDTIPGHLYTSDRFQQDVDLDFLSCEDAKSKTRELLKNLGLPVDSLEFTIYTIDLETLQTVADDMYAAGRFIDPSIDDPNWPVEKDHTVMYKQYSAKDECYYIIVRFLYEGIPLYDSRVGLSDGTNIYTMEKRDGANSPFTISGPICHLLLDQNGFTYARIDSGVCLNFQTVEKPKPILTFQEAQKALASLYVDQVIPKPNSVQKLELCYIPMYHKEGNRFTLVPAWHAELYTYPDQEERPDRIRVEQIFLDAYDGHQLYPSEEVAGDAAS